MMKKKAVRKKDQLWRVAEIGRRIDAHPMFRAGCQSGGNPSCPSRRPGEIA